MQYCTRDRNKPKKSLVRASLSRNHFELIESGQLQASKPVPRKTCHEISPKQKTIYIFPILEKFHTKKFKLPKNNGISKLQLYEMYLRQSFDQIIILYLNTFFRNGDPKWGIATLFLVASPMLLSLVMGLFPKKDNDDDSISADYIKVLV